MLSFAKDCHITIMTTVMRLQYNSIGLWIGYKHPVYGIKQQNGELVAMNHWK